jgi:hypothetical protein
MLAVPPRLSFPGCRATVTTSLETIVTPPKKFLRTGHHLKSPTYFDQNLIVVTISARKKFLAKRGEITYIICQIGEVFF